MEISKEQVSEWLEHLTPKQLVEFFYESIGNRHIYPDEKEYMKSHLVLANATSTKNDTNENWGEWELEILCKLNAEHYPAGFDDNGSICEEGTCCKHKTASYVKHAICSICQKEVYGT